MKNFSAVFLVFTSLSLQAQFFYHYNGTISVRQDNEFLSAPWAGGLNAAQYNSMDLNDDGNVDLVIFDRMAQKVLTFLNDDGAYLYAPEYEAFFPGEISNWLLLRDFDNDGRKDIFTGDVLGIRVFKNVSVGSTLIWEPFFFFAGGSRSEVLLTRGLSGKINLQMQFDDLPSLTDIDGDGDLDIFCMDYGGSGKVELHRNFSVERYGNTDSLDFELITKTWGEFAECDCAVFAFNNQDCSSAGGRTKHAGGKSLLALDANGDGKMDMLLSEAECNKLSFLRNDGTWDAPVVSTASNFPLQSPAIFPLYPTGYFEDVDFDGVKDLMVTPNIFSKTEVDTDLRASNWFYKNTGSDIAPDFELVGKAFLQETMIDVGDNAVPAFADLDGDGDLDLFISSNHFPSTITVYKNTGSGNLPAFEFFTNDFLNLSSHSFSNMKIQLIDINRDQTIDLAFTATQNGLTKLFVMLNKSKGMLDFSGATPQVVDFSFSGPENLHLVDINNDGNPDILRGRSSGSLEYWRNTGNLTFTLENAQYLGMGSNALRVNPVTASADLDGDGKMDLIITDHTGQLRIISDFKNGGSNANAQTDIVYNSITDSHYAPNLGGRVWPVAVNLFGGGIPSIVVGTSLGGLRVLSPDTGFETTPAVHIYPNPLRKGETLYVDVNRSTVYEIYSSQGALVQSSRQIPFGLNRLEFHNLAQGVYIVRFLLDNKRISRRLIIH